jgi:hypothetical protein
MTYTLSGWDQPINFDDLPAEEIDYRVFHDILDVAGQALENSQDPRRAEMLKVLDQLVGKSKIHLFFPEDRSTTKGRTT